MHIFFRDTDLKTMIVLNVTGFMYDTYLEPIRLHSILIKTGGVSQL